MILHDQGNEFAEQEFCGIGLSNEMGLCHAARDQQEDPPRLLLVSLKSGRLLTCAQCHLFGAFPSSMEQMNFWEGGDSTRDGCYHSRIGSANRRIQ
jgi:hypothetical protein